MDGLAFRHIACALAIAILGSNVAADQQAAERPNAPFLSVLRQETNVFATSKTGIYRADLKSRQWRKLDLPADMPNGGKFAKVPDDSSILVYVVSGRFNRFQNEQKTYGIYASRDAGDNWTLLSEHDDYGPVLLLPNGTMFAVTNPSSSNSISQIHESKDMGKTWRNISGNCGHIVDIFPDPDHPNQVCLNVSSIREYFLQADDERYIWNWTLGWNWRQERMNAERFFARTYSSSRSPRMLPATPDNYFNYEFGDRAEIPAIDLNPDQTRIVVAAGDPIVVPVVIESLQHGQIKLVDCLSSNAHWGIRIEFQGQRIAKSAKANDVFRAKDRDAARRRLLSEAKYKDVTLSQSTPYRSQVNITQLHDFSRKGTYRVQLMYDNRWFGGDDSGHWLGRFSSPVFEVVVEDSKP